MELEFKTYVRTGDQLRHFAAPVTKYNTRECFGRPCDFIFGEQQDKVFVLYGLRRTGKTNMIRQAILKMTEKNRSAKPEWNPRVVDIMERSPKTGDQGE